MLTICAYHEFPTKIKKFITSIHEREEGGKGKKGNIACLVNKKAGPSLMPFDATNLKRLKINHLDRTGIPCSICIVN